MACDLADPPRQLASYETGDSAAGAAPATMPPSMPPCSSTCGASATSTPQSPKGDRNLAAVLFQEGKYAEAAEAYAALVRDEPGRRRAARQLGGRARCAGPLRRGAARSSTAPSQPQPLNPEAYHNRAVIYEKQGQRDAAIAEYRTALRYSPAVRAVARRAAPPRRRHGRRDAADADRQTARAGRARQPIWRAAATTPARCARSTRPSAPRRSYALVYHYRANVAFLMGDRAGAIAALQQALAIEPDNALFRENLARLRGRDAVARQRRPATRRVARGQVPRLQHLSRKAALELRHRRAGSGAASLASPDLQHRRRLRSRRA